MMGNRGGALHNNEREIVRAYKSWRWITCVLEFTGRYRIVMSPNRYTELFFLDEAVAFAAGHRPCAECRRERYNAFRRAWQSAHRQRWPSICRRNRCGDATRENRQSAAVCSLPDGCFVQVDGSSYLVWDDALLLWTPTGYTRRETLGRSSREGTDAGTCCGLFSPRLQARSSRLLALSLKPFRPRFPTACCHV